MKLAIALAAVMALFTAPASALVKESFTLAPNSAPYQTAIEFEAGKEYGVVITGSVTATDRFGQETIIDAYGCVTGVWCQSTQTWDRQNFTTRVESGALLAFPNDSQPKRGADGVYRFPVTGFPDDDRITFVSLADSRVEGEPMHYSGPGFTFKIQELASILTGEFLFHVDGAPDRPSGKFLPDDLVSVEVKTSPHTRVGGPDKEHLIAEGALTMINSYRTSGGGVRKRRVHLAIDDTAVALQAYDARFRSVAFVARAGPSHDPNCESGAAVRFELNGRPHKGATLEMAPDRGADCLSKRALLWHSRASFQRALIRRLRPTPASELRALQGVGELLW